MLRTMIKLRLELSQIITSKPDSIQFAKDRKFEEAWIIPLNQSRPSSEEVADYLHKDKFKTLIVEYVWRSDDDDNRFVLTLFLDDKCQLKNHEEFMKICLDLFYEYPGFENFIKTINDKIIGKDYLLNEPVDSVNMSVFNHWLSVGPVDLWNKGETYDFEKIKSKILSRPDIERSSLNYQGLFFRFNVSGNLNGPYYGIKTPCCNKVGKHWVTDYKKVNYWIKLMLGL